MHPKRQTLLYLQNSKWKVSYKYFFISYMLSWLDLHHDKGKEN